MQRALIVGGSGFVGRSLSAYLGPDKAIATYSRTAQAGMVPFDAVNETFAGLLARLPSDISHVYVLFGVVNPELCAKDPTGTAVCNVDATIRLLRGVFDAGLLPVFVSTDYVFDGTRGARREDEPQTPNTEYGRQKAFVERWIQEKAAPWMIARLSKVVSGNTATHSVLGPWINDIRSGTRMRSATDQVFSPALDDDIARALADLGRKALTGVFHVAGPQALSRYDLNKMLVEAVRVVDSSINVDLGTCSLRDVPFREQRPLNTSLSVAKMQSVLDWRFAEMAAVCQRAAQIEFGGAAARAGLDLSGDKAPQGTETSRSR